uniref:non-specific serine/threonine protein kinase n=1 Tax=Coccidioides posadasii RMSCC 3488 TaxID=454284 RepID=A0A0J6FQ62_COCPO|nr:hypothetical protein CPAG_07421 [Coccidioides posadasii RMSCC 3488]
MAGFCDVFSSQFRQWKSLSFSNSNFPWIPLAQKIKEETIPGYVTVQYYSVCIGEVFNKRYQVVGKPEYGATSTVWLWDMNCCNYVTLKIFITSTSMGQQLDALDYLHSKCKIIHDNIKFNNIMLGIADNLVFTYFKKSCVVWNMFEVRDQKVKETQMMWKY